MIIAKIRYKPFLEPEMRTVTKELDTKHVLVYYFYTRKYT